MVSDIVLAPGVVASEQFGNVPPSQIDADGVFTAGFESFNAPIIVAFTALDVDFVDEVEFFVTGELTQDQILAEDFSGSQGFLRRTANDGINRAVYYFDPNELSVGTNTLVFRQNLNDNFKWGISDLLVRDATADFILTPGTAETGKFGNRYDGATSSDGLVIAHFEGTTSDLDLRLNAFDVDFNDEIEVILNGNRLGFLNTGTNDAISSHELAIPAAQQAAGTNTLIFAQARDVGFRWGVTDIQLVDANAPPPADFDLALGTPEPGAFGNKFGSSTIEPDRATATFQNTGIDLRVDFQGFDIDYDDEVAVFLNANTVNQIMLGLLPTGVNDGSVDYSIDIPAIAQLPGENRLSFVQMRDPNFKWGVSSIQLVDPNAPLPPDFSLMLGTTEAGAFGNKFGTSTIEPDRATGSFEGDGTDLRVVFKGFDVDYDDEIEVVLNAGTDNEVSLGQLTTGANDASVDYSVNIPGVSQVIGENRISFVQIRDQNFTWGVTEILLTDEPAPPVPPPPADFSLAPGARVNGPFGNKYGADTIASDRAVGTFESIGEDMAIVLEAFDLDFPNEVEVILNQNSDQATSLGFLDPGSTNGNEISLEFRLVVPASALLPGENSVSFVQNLDANFKWGVSNLIVGSAAPTIVPLQLGATDFGAYGNRYLGQSNTDGQVTVTFDGTGQDLTLYFDAFDVDTSTEIEVSINGNVSTFLPVTRDNAAERQSISLPASSLNVGPNEITFRQTDKAHFAWGVSGLLLDEAPTTVRPSDPLYGQQWHLADLGELERVWGDYTGDRVSIAVFDDGVEATHPDLATNYDATKHVLLNGQPVDGTDGALAHGTFAAGLIAADANNGQGGVGVAFDSTVTGVNVVTGPLAPTDTDFTPFAEAMGQMSDFDIVAHSWEFLPFLVPIDASFEPATDQFLAEVLPTLASAALTGRGGLGTLIIKAAGNNPNLGAFSTVMESAQRDQLNASRFTTVVGSIDSTDTIDDYSSSGANVLVTAPSSASNFFDGLKLASADVTGLGGYQHGDYTNTSSFTGFGVTEWSAALASGVASLMLEANPNLGWRDVQSIFAYSARHAGSPINKPLPAEGSLDALFAVEDFPWRFNGATNKNGGGLAISEDYGFGAIDALAAVRMAEAWSYFDAPQTSGNDADISRSATPVTNIGLGITVPLVMTNEQLLVEQVQVSVVISDPTLDIRLVSPAGTSVQLYQIENAANPPLDWTFSAELFRGEEVDGTWSLIIDNADGSAAVLESYSVEFWGQDGAALANDVYHYTPDMFEAVVYDPSGPNRTIADVAGRTVLSDTDGGTDWVNFAAIDRPVSVDLNSGGSATAGGTTVFALDAGTVIENATGGEWQDVLVGNVGANRLLGMGGNDTLTGGAGGDVFLYEIGDDADVITDFEVGVDELHLFDTGFATSGSLLGAAASDSPAGALLSFGSGDSILLEGVTVAALSAGDIELDPIGIV